MSKQSVLDLTLRQLAMSELGRIGGKSRSPAKLQSSRKNVRKAIAARQRNRRLAKAAWSFQRGPV